jgi:hypothetical protein
MKDLKPTDKELMICWTTKNAHKVIIEYILDLN